MGRNSITSTSRLLVIIASITVVVMSLFSLLPVEAIDATARSPRSLIEHNNEHSREHLNPWPMVVPRIDLRIYFRSRLVGELSSVIMRRELTVFKYKRSKVYEATGPDGVKTEVNYKFDFHVDAIKNSAYTTLLVLEQIVHRDIYGTDYGDKVYEVKRQLVNECEGIKVTRRGTNVTRRGGSRRFAPEEDTFCMYELKLVAVTVDNAEDEGYMYYAPQPDSDEGVMFDPRYNNAMRGQGKEIRRLSTTYSEGYDFKPFRLATSGGRVANPQKYVGSSVVESSLQYTAALSNEAISAVQRAMANDRGCRDKRSLYFTILSKAKQPLRRNIQTAEDVLLSLIKNKGKADGRHESLKVVIDHTCTSSEIYFNYLEYTLGVEKDVLIYQLLTALSMMNCDEIPKIIRSKHAALVVTEDGAFAVLPSQRFNNWSDAFDDKTFSGAIQLNITGTADTLRLVHVPVVIPSAGDKGTHVEYRAWGQRKQFIFDLRNAVKDLWELTDGPLKTFALVRPEQLRDANESNKPGEHHEAQQQVLRVFDYHTR